MTEFLRVKRGYKDSKSYRPELDGIRGVAILLVLAEHLASKYISFGFLGVDMFFVLSGYVIYITYFSRPIFSLRNFLLRRFSRLGPGILVVLLFNLLLPKLRNMSSTSDFLKTVFLVKNFGNWTWPLGPYWSLSAEEQFYLLAGSISIILKKVYFKKVLFVSILIFCCTIEITGLLLSLTKYDFNEPNLFNLVIIRPIGIAIGVLLAFSEKHSYFERIHLSKGFSSPYLIVFILIITVYLRSSTFASLLTMIIIWNCGNSKIINQIKKFFSNKFLVTIGILSYSIYIWHVTVIVLIPDLQSKVWDRLLKIVIILIVSYLSYILLEFPLRNFINRRFTLN